VFSFGGDNLVSFAATIVSILTGVDLPAPGF
jgi:hypothetical protein